MDFVTFDKATLAMHRKPFTQEISIGSAGQPHNAIVMNETDFRELHIFPLQLALIKGVLETHGQLLLLRFTPLLG